MERTVKNFIYSSLLLVMALVVTACGENALEEIIGSVDNPTETTKYITFTAELDASAISEIDLWEVGTKAAVIYDVAGTKKSAEAQVTAVSGKKATVSVSVEEGITNNSQITVIYPASAADGTTGSISDAAIASQDGVHTPFALTAMFSLSGTTASLSNIECGDYAVYKMITYHEGVDEIIRMTDMLIFKDDGQLLTTISRELGTATTEPVYATLPLVKLGYIQATSEANKPYIIKSGATMVKGYQHTELQMFTIGDLYNSDGSFSTSAQTNNIGVIAYLGHDSYSESVTDVGGTPFVGHGLVLCLKNSTSGVPIYQNGTTTASPSTVCGTWVSSTEDLKRTTDVSGYKNTKALKEINSPAATQTMTYTALAAPADITTGWFIPSAQQFVKMLEALGEVSSSDIKWGQKVVSSAATKWDDAVKKAGSGKYDPFSSSLFYWTSSAYGEGGVVYMEFTNSSSWCFQFGFRTSSSSSDYSRIRPILAF